MKKTLLALCIGASFMVQAQTTFGPKQPIDTSADNTPYVIESAFLDNDAYKDIVVATEAGTDVTWYKNNGDGTFTKQPLISSNLS